MEDHLARNASRAASLLGALGAVLVGVSLGAPWFLERTEGGLTGKGNGRPPVLIELWDVSPLLVAALALAALVGLGQTVVALTPLGGRLNSLGLVVAGGGALVVAAIAVTLELRPFARLACCDQIYTVATPRLGLLLGVGGAVVMFVASQGASLHSRRRRRRP